MYWKDVLAMYKENHAVSADSTEVRTEASASMVPVNLQINNKMSPTIYVKKKPRVITAATNLAPVVQKEEVETVKGQSKSNVNTEPSPLVSLILGASPRPIEFKDPANTDVRPKKQLVIGLDFGTAFTKVVVGDITYAYAVPAGAKNYLFPSQLHIDEQGNCSLDKINCVETISNLKLPLILGLASTSHLYSVVAFLALILSHSRRWVLESTPFANQSVSWLLNVGLPAETYDDCVLNKQYINLLETAWVLSFASSITLNAAKQLWNSQNLQLIPEAVRLPVGHLSLFPEFIAQIVGYVQSPSRRLHSHLLVDIGAGTLDVAFFTVKNIDGIWTFHTYGQQVKPLGVDMFYHHRLQTVNSSAQLDNSAFPSDKEFCKRFSISKMKLKEADSIFIDKVAKCIFDTLYDSDQNYLGGISGSPMGWRDSKITTFICGGGASIPHYTNVFARTPLRYPLEHLPLPIPERLKTKKLSKNMYQRLSVAYGLSFDPFNIGEVFKQTRDSETYPSVLPPHKTAHIS